MEGSPLDLEKNDGSAAATPGPGDIALCVVDDAVDDSSRSATTTTCIESLPNEMLARIFAFLPGEDWFSTAPRVCTRWRRVVLATPLSPAALSWQGFYVGFQGIIPSFFDDDGNLMLDDGMCMTTERVKAIAAFIKSNVKIEGWGEKI